MAYNTTDQVYYLKQYSEIKDEFTEEQLVSFLEDVLEGRAKVWCILEGVDDHDSVDREARGLLPKIARKGRSRPKGLPFSGFRYFIYLFLFVYICHIKWILQKENEKYIYINIYIFHDIYIYIYIYHY